MPASRLLGLRGYQITDENGIAEFITIYPGWYSGRTVHIHFKIRTDSEQGYEFTPSRLTPAKDGATLSMRTITSFRAAKGWIRPRYPRPTIISRQEGRVADLDHKERWGRTPHFYYTRVTYSPVSVLIRIVSPSFTNSGTLTDRPVSVTTFLLAPVAVSPAMAFSASVTFCSTVVGRM